MDLPVLLILLSSSAMKTLRPLGLTALIIILPSFAQAATTVNGAVYTIDESVNFSIANSGASHFVLAWTDPGGAGTSFSDVQDPTLVLTVGQTYVFDRTTGSHPFAITTSAMAVTGSDGVFQREGNQRSDIDPFILTPNADFTAEPNGSANEVPITWTPTAADLGDYWYTCTIRGHLGMTGKITVVPEPSVSVLGFLALGFLARRRR